MEGSRQKAELRHVASRCLLELGNNVSQLRAAKATRERIRSWMREVSPSCSAAGSCSENESADSVVLDGGSGTGTTGTGPAPAPKPKSSIEAPRRKSGASNTLCHVPERRRKLVLGAQQRPLAPTSAAGYQELSKGDHVMISYRCVRCN